MGLTTSTSNASPCEICGGLAPDHYRRDAESTRPGGYRYRRTRQQRRRIDRSYWNISSIASRLNAAGMADWAGRTVCPECYARFSGILNT